MKLWDCDPPLRHSQTFHFDLVTRPSCDCRADFFSSLNFWKYVPPTVTWSRCCTWRREIVQTIALRDNQGRGCMSSPTSNYLDDHTCEERRKKKLPLLDSLWFHCAELLILLLSNFNVANYIIYIAVASVHLREFCQGFVPGFEPSPLLQDYIIPAKMDEKRPLAKKQCNLIQTLILMIKQYH